MATVLSVKNLSVKNKENKIISDISFEVNAGDVVALTGLNGSGKSTILKSIVGDCDYGVVSGDVRFLDSDNILMQKDRQWFNRNIGYVEQENEFVQLTAFEEVEYCIQLYDKILATDEYIHKLFDTYGLSHLENRKLYGRHGCQLSGGEKKMLAILCAIAREGAKLLIIDEPLNNLDINNVRKISNMITRLHNEKKDLGILMVTHCRVFPCVNKMISIKNGKIVPNEEEYICHTCFGKPNKQGYYD